MKQDDKEVKFKKSIQKEIQWLSHVQSVKREVSEEREKRIFCLKSEILMQPKNVYRQY